MKIYFVGITFFLSIFCVPIFAYAHASPTSYAPESGEQMAEAPSEVRIRFSERVESGASRITVKNENGETISVGEARVDSRDPYSLFVAVSPQAGGVLFVSWGVVSSDDGHFTKGTYPFGVGAGVPAKGLDSNTEVVTITTTPEALGMTLELMGNGIIWALLLLFVFAVRPILRREEFQAEGRRIHGWYVITMLFAGGLVFLGGIAQIVAKAQSLASLQEASFWQAVPLYIGTNAGSATMYRLLAVFVVLTVLIIGRKAIFKSKVVSSFEIIMMLAMCFFVYFRASVSHATANLFHPHFSVAVNFVHLIEKDFWAGTVGILLALALIPRMRHFLSAFMPKVSKILAINLALLSTTACYIVWLHLKSFDNLFTTQWGSAFMQLLIMAVLLVGLRLYHTLARVYRPGVFSKLLPSTLAAEFAVGILVVYCSSVVIVTSPPLPQPYTKIFTAESSGVVVRLERDANEDGMLMLTASGKSNLKMPVVMIADTIASEELLVNLSKRFDDGYVFPASFFAGKGPFNVGITVPQDGGYDAQAIFEVTKEDFSVPEGYQSKRVFDWFATVMVAVTVSAVVFALTLWWLSGFPAADTLFKGKVFIQALAAAGAFLAVSFFGTHLFTAFGSSALSNPYKAECESDGNAWHFMLPSKEGKEVSQISKEGCMWGMGKYMYHFTDKREYDYYGSFSHAEVSLEHSPQNIIAGVPAQLTVSLANDDGTPAVLFLDMEKYIHMVIVSEDQTTFAHIHPDDARTLTQKEIESSVYRLTHVFPKASTYLISVDYAHGLQLESKQFTVTVGGGPAQSDTRSVYPSPGSFDGYDVELGYGALFAGEVQTIRYTIQKNGKPVDTLEPYLSAPMHLSIVKDDLSEFVHTHGEVHPPGAPYPPIIIKNGKVLHSMTMMSTPVAFGPKVEAHVIFPSAGVYTVFGQFKDTGKIIVTKFTVKVER